MISSCFFAQKSYASLKTKYRTSFGRCPTRTIGPLSLDLVEHYEKSESLGKLKNYILKENIVEQFYLSSYEIAFQKEHNSLVLKFDCPRPLLKVQVYKDNGNQSYSALMIENGDLIDPTYETLLRSESLLKGNLPTLAIPLSSIEDFDRKKLAGLISELPTRFRSRLSEVILAPESELTVILSIKGRAVSAFLGKDHWSFKFDRLRKTINYLVQRKKIPTLVNLRRPKKVVVKFPRSL